MEILHMYVPLMSVEGFPVSLSYHAGMTTDMDASWVGLGWYLNPGAINRSVTNTPDDWKGGTRDSILIHFIKIPHIMVLLLSLGFQGLLL